MAETYSVKARLSAVDSGFTSTLKNATSAVSGLGEKIKSGFAFGVLAGVGQQAFSSMTQGVRGLVSEIDSSNASWKTFESNLSMLDWDSSAIDGAKKSLQDFAQQTVYSSSDMATTFSQLAAVGVKDTANLVQAFGGLAAAAENPQQAMKTLSQQATQMAAKPTVAWQDFKLMLEQTPAGIAAVAREMDMSTAELVSNVQAGKISTEEFFDAIKKAGGEGTELADLAKEAKTIGQAFDGLKETLANKLGPAFAALSDIGIKAIEGITNALDNLGDAETIKAAVVGWIEDAKPLWESFKNAAVKVWQVISGVGKQLAPIFSALKSTVGGAVKSVLDQIGKINAQAIVKNVGDAIKKMQPYFDALKSVVQAVANVIAKILPYVQKAAAAIGNFFLNNSATISKFIPVIAAVVGAFKGFNLVKSIFGKASSAVSSATSAMSSGVSKAAQIIESLGDLMRDVGASISMAARGIGEGVQKAFVGIGKALKIANPVNILAVGAAFAIAAAGVALIATQGEGVAAILGGIGDVVASVGTALGNVLALAIRAVAEALVILAPVMPIISQSLVMLTPLVKAFGEAFSMVAEAIGVAMSKIVVAIGEAVARIVEALTPVVEIIGNVITKIVEILVDGVVRIVEALAPVLPAFTKMFTEIARIVSESIVAIIEALAPYMPEISKIVEATSAAIQAICEAFTTLVEQVKPVIDSITELISTFGTTLSDIISSVSDLISSLGDSINSVITGIGDAISGILDSIAGIFESIGTAAKNAGTGFKRVAEGLQMISEISIVDLVKSLGAVGDGMATMAKHGEGVAQTGAGLRDLVSAFSSVTSASVAANAAVMALTSAFANLATTATQAGESAGNGFVDGMTAGLSAAPGVAEETIESVVSVLDTGESGAYSSGAFIGVGLANGMLSMLATVKAAADELVAQANRAIEAKAKIGSPSKITTQYGEWYGEGYVNGISGMVKKAWNAAEQLVSFPAMNTPNLAMAYGGELSADYSYSRNGVYTFEIPVIAEGREIARATATYMQEELNRHETRNARKMGRV